MRQYKRLVLTLKSGVRVNLPFPKGEEFTGLVHLVFTEAAPRVLSAEVVTHRGQNFEYEMG